MRYAQPARLHAATLASALLVSAAAVAADREISGLVEPLHDVLLSAPVSGAIVAIPQGEGTRVTQGAVLVELDARLEELEVERRRLVREDLTELTAARARAALLAKDLEATRALYESTGSVSGEELDKKTLESRLGALDVARLEQVEERERIEHDMAAEQLRRRRVHAPFDGVVANELRDVGANCQPQEPILRLVDDSVCNLSVMIEADAARGIIEGAAARLRFDGEPAVEKDGTVHFVSPIVDPASGLLTIKLRFANTEPRVKPGSTGVWLRRGGDDGAGGSRP